MPDTSIRQVLKTAQSHAWIKSIEHQSTGKIARLRLLLEGKGFVAVYHNAETGSTSYAYVENDERLFGANNMKIGWHMHPWGEYERHILCEPIGIEAFLGRLEGHLREQRKIG